MSDKALSLDGAKTLYNDLRARIVGLDVGGETPTITVDSSLSSTSINPVENRVITSKVNEIVSSVTNNTSLLNTINTEVSRISDELESVSTTAESASSLSSALLVQSSKQSEDIKLLNAFVSRAETNITNLNTLITELNEEHDADIEELRTSTIDYSRITNAPTLAKVAETGSYGDLTNTPTLATVALSGNYEDLSTKPDIPILSSGIKENDSGYVTGGMVFDYVKTGGSSPFDPTYESGYTYLDNGMLLQWGIVTIDSYKADFTYPVSFVATCIFAVGFIFMNSAGEHSGHHVWTPYDPLTIASSLSSISLDTPATSSFDGRKLRVFTIGY